MGGKQDGFCRFHLTLNSRDRGSSRKSVPGPRERFVAGSGIVALPHPPFGTSLGVESCEKGERGVSWHRKPELYLIVLFGYHRLVGNAKVSAHGGELSSPEAALVCTKGHVLGGEG